jgi:dTDP-D-glucose 4,6-dehydratase
MMILVTGGAGFIGANFILELMAASCELVVILDKFRYAGNLGNLASIDTNTCRVPVRGDIYDQALVLTKPLVKSGYGEYLPRVINQKSTDEHYLNHHSGRVIA